MVREIKNIQDFKNKRVLVRVDFNVAIDEKGDVKERFKIEAAKEMVMYLKKAGAQIALLSHLGRPEECSCQKDSKRTHEPRKCPKLSTCRISDDVERIFRTPIQFVPACVGKRVEEALSNNKEEKIILLENIRFEKKEAENNMDFAKELAKPFDAYINEAFSVCHRQHSSVVAIAQVLPSFAGIRLKKEIDVLTKVKENPEKPAVAIIGGAKIHTKLPMIKMFEKKYDIVLVGGKIANEAVDEKITFAKNVLLPNDFADEKRRDIGKKTIKNFCTEISRAKTIVWNGPMGMIEKKPFEEGTYAIAKEINKTKAFEVVGGGESLQVLEEMNILDNLDFVSTGGGAMLAFLSGEIMPGIQILTDKG
ncbi:MAG: phosphoglycerate kinase [Candidatus Moranbacteria bacterium]|nr:phosphoglycerate kinase [Candidatus Moranbacteria bacterium]